MTVDLVPVSPLDGRIPEATRLSCRTEHEPFHPPISQKIHFQPDLSFRHFSYTTTLMGILQGNCALGNWRSQSSILPVSHGNTSSIVKPVPPAFIGAPMENSKAFIIKDLALFGVLKTALAPFERVKLLMQNQNHLIKSSQLPKPYNGILDCFARTIRNEGVLSLWRGYTAMTLADVSLKVMRFAIFRYALSREDFQWTYPRLLVLDSVVIVTNQLLFYPFLYAGARKANDVKAIGSTGNWQFNGIVDVFRKTLKSDGIAGLYRGFNIRLAEFGMMGAVSAGLKPWKQHYSSLLQNNVFWRHMVEFGFGICANMAIYPLDTVNKRMMMTSGAVKYKSTRQAIAQIMKTEGLKSFYSGAGAEILSCAVYKGTVLLIIYVADVIRAAKEKNDYCSRSTMEGSLRQMTRH
ncbi:hypothetical protein ES319_A10G029200v1 [Gossypium barbadense]|nr:hypothetical protein ES319_A10G029200v1 [Gossypium barbadense]